MKKAGVTIPINLPINIVGEDVNKLQQAINKLSLPKNMGDGLLRQIEVIKKESENLAKLNAKGTGDNASVAAAERSAKIIEASYGRIAHIITGMSKEQKMQIFAPEELAKVKEIEAKITSTKKAIEDINSKSTKFLQNEIVNNAVLHDILIKQKGMKIENITNEQQISDALQEQLTLLKEQQAARDTLLTTQKFDAAAFKQSAQYQEVLNKYVKGGVKGKQQSWAPKADKEAAFADLTKGLPEQLVTTIRAEMGDLGKLSYGDFTKAFNAAATKNIDPAVLKNMIPDPKPEVDKIVKAQQALDDMKSKLGNRAGDLKKELAQLQQQLGSVSVVIDGKSKASISDLMKLYDQGKVNVEQLETAVAGLKTELTSMQEVDSAQATFNSRLKQLLGFGAMFHQISRIVRSAVKQIKELDAAMTQIAVVTDFTTNQLWGQIDAYMALAKQYGVTTTGVYEVSQLYYQQGLSTNEVMKMTTETLKMAKIAGLDYADATDYMTVAIRGFKMGFEDGQRVVDVYSKLAAVAATDTRELAIAMSKTASIAESAGMSFENTSVFLTQMIEVTREAPENIGTAMKTIIARFQELKKSPLEIAEVEGEEVSFNKIDKALQTVGVSLTSATGQFRNLDEVIYELADKWDSLDRNTQRYIATTVAGSRQQSRFLAMMSDSSRLHELQTDALDAEDAALIQYSKTLNSIESKLNQLSTGFQNFYMSIINGPGIKGVLDVVISIVDQLNKIPSILLIAVVPGIIALIKRTGALFSKNFIDSFLKTKRQIENQTVNIKVQTTSISTDRYQEARFTPSGRIYDKQNKRLPASMPISSKPTANLGETVARGSFFGAIKDKDFKLLDFFAKGDPARGVTKFAQGLQTAGKFAAGMTSALSTASMYITVAVIAFQVISGLAKAFFEWVDPLNKSLEDLKEQALESKAQMATSRSEAKDLDSLATKYRELQYTYEDSAEKKQEWIELNATIVEKYPELLGGIDEEGNYIADLTAEYETLAETKKKAALEDSQTWIKDEFNVQQKILRVAKEQAAAQNIVANITGDPYFYYDKATNSYQEKTKVGKDSIIADLQSAKDKQGLPNEQRESQDQYLEGLKSAKSSTDFQDWLSGFIQAAHKEAPDYSGVYGESGEIIESLIGVDSPYLVSLGQEFDTATKQTAVDMKQATANMENLSDIYFKIEAGIRATVSTQDSFLREQTGQDLYANIMSKEFLSSGEETLSTFIDNKAKYDAAVEKVSAVVEEMSDTSQVKLTEAITEIPTQTLNELNKIQTETQKSINEKAVTATIDGVGSVNEKVAQFYVDTIEKQKQHVIKRLGTLLGKPVGEDGVIDDKLMEIIGNLTTESAQLLINNLDKNRKYFETQIAEFKEAVPSFTRQDKRQRYEKIPTPTTIEGINNSYSDLYTSIEEGIVGLDGSLKRASAQAVLQSLDETSLYSIITSKNALEEIFDDELPKDIQKQFDNWKSIALGFIDKDKNEQEPIVEEAIVDYKAGLIKAQELILKNGKLTNADIDNLIATYGFEETDFVDGYFKDIGVANDKIIETITKDYKETMASLGITATDAGLQRYIDEYYTKVNEAATAPWKEFIKALSGASNGKFTISSELANLLGAQGIIDKKDFNPVGDGVEYTGTQSPQELLETLKQHIKTNNIEVDAALAAGIETDKVRIDDSIINELDSILAEGQKTTDEKRAELQLKLAKQITDDVVEISDTEYETLDIAMQKFFTETGTGAWQLTDKAGLVEALKVLEIIGYDIDKIITEGLANKATETAEKARDEYIDELTKKSKTKASYKDLITGKEGVTKATAAEFLKNLDILNIEDWFDYYNDNYQAAVDAAARGSGLPDSEIQAIKDEFKVIDEITGKAFLDKISTYDLTNLTLEQAQEIESALGIALEEVGSLQTDGTFKANLSVIAKAITDKIGGMPEKVEQRLQRISRLIDEAISQTNDIRKEELVVKTNTEGLDLTEYNELLELAPLYENYLTEVVDGLFYIKGIIPTSAPQALIDSIKKAARENILSSLKIGEEVTLDNTTVANSGFKEIIEQFSDDFIKTAEGYVVTVSADMIAAIQEEWLKSADLTGAEMATILESQQTLIELPITRAREAAAFLDKISLGQKYDKFENIEFVKNLGFDENALTQALDEFELSLDQLEELTPEQLLELAEKARDASLIDPAAFDAASKEFKDATNKELVDGLINSTGEFSKEFGDKFKDTLSAAGIELESIVDGYNYTGPVEAYLTAIEQLIYEKFGAAAMLEFQEGKRRDIGLSMYQGQLNQLGGLSADFNSDELIDIATNLDKVGISAEQASMLIYDMGFGIEEFYKNANGKFSLTGINKWKTIEESIATVNSKIKTRKENILKYQNAISKATNITSKQSLQELKLLQNETRQYIAQVILLQTLINLKSQEQVKSFSFLSSADEEPITDNMQSYLNFITDLGTWVGQTKEFAKTRKMGQVEFFDMIHDSPELLQAMNSALGQVDMTAEQLFDHIGKNKLFVDPEDPFGFLIPKDTFGKYYEEAKRLLLEKFEEGRKAAEQIDLIVDAVIKPGNITIGDLPGGETGGITSQIINSKLKDNRLLQQDLVYELQNTIQLKMNGKNFSYVIDGKEFNTTNFGQVLTDALGSGYISTEMKARLGVSFIVSKQEQLTQDLQTIVEGAAAGIDFPPPSFDTENIDYDGIAKYAETIRKALGIIEIETKLSEQGLTQEEIQAKLVEKGVTVDVIANIKAGEPLSDEDKKIVTTAMNQILLEIDNTGFTQVSTSVDAVKSAVDLVKGAVDTVKGALDPIASAIANLFTPGGGSGDNGNNTVTIDDESTDSNTIIVKTAAATDGMITDVQKGKEEAEKIPAIELTTSADVKGMLDDSLAGKTLIENRFNSNPIDVDTSADTSGIHEGITNIIDTESKRTITLKVKIKEEEEKEEGAATGTGPGGAEGGKTLVGELGPELRVSDGHYSLVGKNGPEFVNLKRGDTIFNHRQTADLLKIDSKIKGQSLASGTIKGQALAEGVWNNLSLPALFESLNKTIQQALGGSATEAAGVAEATEEAAEIYTIELEKWFNWLKRIEQIENKINLLQTQRGNIIDGTDYASSLAQENAYLEAQEGIIQDLIEHQKVERDIVRKKMEGMGDYFSFYGDALTLNNKSIEAVTVGNEALGEEINNLIDEYEEVNSAINENSITLEDNKTKIKDNLRDLRDKTIEVENEVLSALQNVYQQEIDGKQKVIDEKIKANNEYVKALKNSLDEERKLYNKGSKLEEKQQLQRKLSLLQRDTSGRNVSQIVALQQQLRELSQDEYFQKREEAITAQEEGLAMETDTMQNEVTLLQEANQMKLDNMSLYWTEVQEIINQGTAATQGFLTSWSKTYAEASATQQEDYLAQWSLTIEAAWEYSTQLNAINTSLVAVAQAQAATISSFADLQVASYQRIASAAAASKSAQEAATAAASTAAASTVTTKAPSPQSPTFTGYSYISKNSTQHDQYENFSNGTKVYVATESHSYAGRTCLSCGYTKPAQVKVVPAETSSSKVTYTATTAPKKQTQMAYAKGGLADYTGLAMVHGSQSKPESFFDAKATAALIDFTKILRNQIANTLNNAGNTTNTAVGAENMTVNIEVQSGVVNNSAQANQLADTIFDKFVKLANKSGSIKVFRN